MFEYDFQVQYVDINSNGKLSDFGLLKYLQEVACLHADSKGFGLKDTPTNRLAWIILNWKIMFFSRPVWNTGIHIRTWISNIDNVSCCRDFEILDQYGEKIAVATSKWVLLNIDSHHISKITPEIKEVFEPVLPSVLNETFEKITEPEYYDNIFEYTILKRDIDTNNHLNNLNYIMLGKESLPDNIDFSNIEVIYKHQCVLGDRICFMCKKINNGYIVVVKNRDTGIIHANIKFEF